MSSISIRKLRRAIARLPADPPQTYPNKWYSTQKQHWLGWLREYHGPGAYGRNAGVKRDAEYAYNHVVEYRMLLWLVEAAGLGEERLTYVREEAETASTLQGKSAAIRRLVPWEDVARLLWPEYVSRT